MKKIQIFDSTLRDGAQARGINYSLTDKINVLKLLDNFGIDYIEAGNPASNPKEREFFNLAANIKLSHSKLVAFGSTRRKNAKAEDDAGVQALLSANTDTVSIFGKTWDLHVTEVINTTLEENLNMIYDTISFFKQKGKEVIFDAEHYFDGYKANPEYAIQVLQTAEKAGADCLVLCDTNGGTMVCEMRSAVKKVAGSVKTDIGIHTHNDSELAVANSLIAVEEGAVQVQGTLIGFGERCGNARLSSIIPNLELKMGYKCLPDGKLSEIYDVCRQLAELTNLVFDETMAYVGQNAFSHKGGMHIDGIKKAKGSFEHIEPSLVGNSREFLLSEVAGKSAMASKLENDYPEVAKDKKKVAELMNRLKELENEGVSFEGAESSFKIFILKELGLHNPLFNLIHFKVFDEPAHHNTFGAYAVVKVDVNGQTRMTAADGNGPVNALDKALREALGEFFPKLMDVVLTDYKVRVLETNHATGATVRVIIESSDGKDTWRTVGVSTDVIEASLLALIDSIDYKLLENEVQ